ncbi:MAG TPA: hypothetical protein VG013_17465 [Gemmataceae bacterium]|nr:hypothetical protein [Gemmataceae bacterium]
MFSWSKSLDIDCDAPSYAIVRACRRIGVVTPEDVRWCRMNRFLSAHPTWREVLKRPPWKALLGMAQPEARTCSCGQKLPLLEKCTFTFNTGQEVSYLIGQCRRCRTVFWDGV